MNIGDVNDNNPDMDPSPLSGSSSITILENAALGTILVIVRATDADFGDNAHIQYEIDSGNDLGNYMIYSSKIIIIVIVCVTLLVFGRQGNLPLTLTLVW